MVETVRRAVARKPEAEDFVEAWLERSAQFRFSFASGEMWDPRLAERGEPPATAELDD